MDNNQLLKTLAGKTGRDLLHLPGRNSKPTSHDRQPPAGGTEKTIFGMWEELLGHGDLGVHDDFFSVGGNSLKATQLVSRLTRHFSVNVMLEDIFHHPTIAKLGTLIDNQQGGITHPLLEKQSRPERIPLSFSQEGLWVIDRLHGSTHYHLVAALRFEGVLDGAVLEWALGKIVERHEVLRTVIREESGKPYQWVKTAGSWTMKYRKDAAFLNRDLLQRYVQEAINRPFDLSKDDMLRAELLELSFQQHLLILVIHHVAADGWSLPLFAKELTELYNAREEQREPNLPSLPVQFADYAIWQRRHMTGDRLQQQLSYWKQKLDDVKVLELPTDHARPAVQGIGGHCSYFTIHRSLHKTLQAMSQQEGVTLFMTLLSAFYLLLFRYSRQEDICVGCPTGNRSLPETESLIGFFVNTLALRTPISADMRFRELLQAVKQTALEAYRNQEVPFEKIVEEMAVDRGLGRTPLFQVVFLLQNTPEIGDIQLGDSKMTIEPVQQTSVQFELEFSLRETKDGLVLRIEYSNDIYSAATIGRMAGHYIELLQSAVSDPLVKVGECRMLTQEEERQLLSQSGL
ncbi:MAG TPA: condensation domain-containing protein [Puia sp.]|nr:condensation domain-containing protein [Puia sp.]